MRFWKKRLQRVAAMVCSVALVASMMPTAVFATEPEATTPTTEPTSIVDTTPTPELSESPENTDATVTTSAPDTGTGSTSAPEATPAGNTDDTKEPVESPEPSEEPTDDTTESGEEGTETTDSTTVPGEENVEQQVSVPQTLAAAPAAAPETRQTSSFDLKSEDGTVDLGVINYTQGGDQTTTFQVYLNYMPVCTISDVNIQARSIDYNNFQVVANGDYYLRDVTLVDSTLDAQTVVYYESTDSLHFSRGYASGKNTVALYFFNYDSGVEADFNRQVNNGVLHLDEACSELNIHFVVDGFETVTTYTNWSSTIYLPRETQITVTPTINNGYYFEYWHTADAAVGKNNIYTIGADGKPILNYTGPLAGQEGHVAFSESMIVEYGAAFTQGTIGLYMTDGERIDDFYDYKITYSPNGDGVVPETDQIQYFYRSSKGTYGTSIRGCMFKREGYRFKGWNTERDGSGTSYSPDEIYGAIDGEDDLTLYAQWEKIETPQPGIPDVDVTELGAIIAVDCTTAAEDHPTWMSTILGTLEKDYIIEYSSNRTTATIKIANTDLYLDEYCQLKGYHALDETNASDLSFKLKYENDAWVLDSDDNTAATIYVACPDVTVEKKITSVERDGQPLNPVPEMLKVGDEINYQIVITNNSNITLNDLTVTDTFTGANKPGSVSDSEETWEETAGSWTWSDTLTLAVNGKKTFTYTYTVAEGDKGNTIRNSAAVAGKGLDDDEETDDETTPEVENPAVGVEKSLVQVKRGEEIFLAEKGTIPEELEVGDELTYEIEVKNIGNVKLNGLTLTDTFNGHFAPSKVKDKVANVELTNEWEKDTTTGLWTLKIENISPDVGEIETYTYTYIVNQADAGKPLTNTAAVTGDGTDPDDEGKDERPVEDDGTVTIYPADITIYKGGESGSTSVVEDENGTIAKENNSLPTPGFYFDLPDAVNEAVSTYYGVPSAEAVDLSDFITITAKAKDGSDRVWRLEKYGEGETSFTTIDGQEHYIYKLVAGDGQDPVRVQFTDDQGNFVTSDDFTLEDAMCETYTMQIYTGSVDTSTLTIKVEIPEKDDVPAQTFHCGYGATKTATLTVRYVNSEQEEVVTDAVTAITDVAQENTPLENAYVVADSDAVFNVNDSSVSVNQNSVSLLFDDLTTGETETNKAVERLLAIAEDKSGLTGTIEQQAKYLNLVDADNGNAWLTAEEDVTIYWPYPEGTDKNTKFSLLHFDGIDREMAIGNLVSEVEGVTPEPMMITKDDYGISFTTKTFSPFVLMWETEQPSGGEDKPSGGDDGNNDNNNNNTNTNNQTTTVNVANQAAAPAAAPAAVSVPQTSDDMPIGALTAAAVAAAAALVGLLVVRKRRQK